MLPAPAPAAELTFYFGLERPESKAKAAFFAASTPNSAAYRDFFSLHQTAKRYGASARTDSGFLRATRRLGLQAKLDDSGVFARLTGGERRFERAFGVRLRKRYDKTTDSVSYSPTGETRFRLPKSMKPLVREVVPYSVRTARPGERSSASGAGSAATPPGNDGTWADGCTLAEGTGGYSFAQIRSAYGIDALGPGSGASVAMISVGEGLTAGDVGNNADCFGLPELTPHTLLTDGQVRAFGRVSPEPPLDLAMLRGAAPGLSALTVSQVWPDPEVWFLGPADLLGLGSPPDAVSISYGACELEIRGEDAGPSLNAGAKLFDAMLVRLGLVGSSVFAASGDSGSTCSGVPVSGVAWPGSSPYLTAVGGTRLVLDSANDRVDEVVWNDLEWLPSSDGGGAGGGGLSAASRRPDYQDGFAAAGKRRGVPDLAAHASLLPGWPVVARGDWLAVGGTSAASPLLAGAFAVLSASERSAGRPPLGPVNGLVYELAAAAPETVFDVVSGNNAYDARVAARAAGPGYDLASGLGVPRFDELAAALPPPVP